MMRPDSPGPVLLWEGTEGQAPPHPELIAWRLEPHPWRWKSEVSISSYSESSPTPSSQEHK